jgi:hypothetical protein
MLKMPEQSVFKIFDERSLSFLTSLSSKLLSDSQTKAYPDVATFAFWCRKANLNILAKPYQCENQIGRGVTFHIAPSNVPVNFAYSLVSGMLAGNSNIVRLPSKDFVQTKIICTAITELLPEYLEISDRLCLIRYGHDKEITDVLSTFCATRVIWGGDNTVNEIRKSPIPPRTNEITFPDRYSICVINSDEYLLKNDYAKTAKDFYNDTYLTDQNACTSPRIIFWFGNKIDEAKSLIWNSLDELVNTNYEIQAIQTVNKLTSFYKYAACFGGDLEKSKNFKIMRINVNDLTNEIVNHFENSGYFYEYNAKSLDDILQLCNRKCQTLSYIGFDPKELCKYIVCNAPFGVDRIVSVGKTMDFALIWDGINLIDTLSRRISFAINN